MIQNKIADNSFAINAMAYEAPQNQAKQGGPEYAFLQNTAQGLIPEKAEEPRFMLWG